MIQLLHHCAVGSLMHGSTNNPLGDTAQSLDWSAVVTSFATAALAILTVVYVVLTRKILLAQTNPCVIITVQPSESQQTVMQLVVRNTGFGIAYDVRFEFSRDLPSRAFGLTADEAGDTAVMKDGPLIMGIPALGPGETRVIDWGQYAGLFKALGSEVVIATCRFKKNGSSTRKEMPPTFCPLDIVSFERTTGSENSAQETASAMKEISKNLRELVKIIAK